jgi:predicted RNA-binding Zn-ribbon protein involved in translation (DUF1610 family)
MIKRKYARIQIVFCVLAVLSFILCAIMQSMPVAYPIGFACLGVAFLISALLVRAVVLICPSCGKRGLRPQWSKNRTFYCAYCGKPIEYEQ